MPPGPPPAAEPAEPQVPPSEVGLATITLRQIRVSRADVQEKPTSADANPMNLLVPYLDLYGRLTDEELSRLAGVPATVVNNLRLQVVQVDRALARFTDLLPRLTDAELVRLTGATPKTIRFWRLCQPRLAMAGTDAPGWSVAQAADALGRVQTSAELTRRPGTGPHQAAVMSDEPPLDSGMPLEHRRHPSSEIPRYGGRHPSGETPSPSRHPSGESPRDGSSAYRMPAAERDAGRRTFEPPPSPASPGSRITGPPAFPVDLSRPRTGRTEEMPAASGSPPVLPRTPKPLVEPPPEVVQKQQAVAQQMAFSGAPFPGYDSEASGRMSEDDGIFIGLELPDPRTLANPGRRG